MAQRQDQAHSPSLTIAGSARSFLSWHLQPQGAALSYPTVFLQWLEGEGQSLIQFHLLQAKSKTLATHEDHNMSSSPTKKPKQAARLLWEVTALTVFHIFINTGFVLWYLKFIYYFTISPILYFWNSDYWPMIHTGQSVLS